MYEEKNKKKSTKIKERMVNRKKQVVVEVEEAIVKIRLHNNVVEVKRDG